MYFTMGVSIFLRPCVCVLVCVCERGRERERERDRGGWGEEKITIIIGSRERIAADIHYHHW